MFWYIYSIFCLFIFYLAYQYNYSKYDLMVSYYTAYLAYIGINDIQKYGFTNLLDKILNENYMFENGYYYLLFFVMLFTYDSYYIYLNNDKKMLIHHLFIIVSFSIILMNNTNTQSLIFLALPVELSNPLYYGYRLSKIITNKIIANMLKYIFLLSFVLRYGYILWIIYCSLNLNSDYWILHITIWIIFILNTMWLYGGIKLLFK